MTRQQQAFALFKRATDIPETELERFLNQECVQDMDLRKRVEQLLSVRNAAQNFLPDEASSGTIADADLPRDSRNSATGQLGTNIGPYKLLQEIGEGGFGVVYMAAQQEPVRRQVALKIIKPGMDSREVIARFEAELQALALMDHPSIARVFDAGQTENGRPYFVMELVKGLPITEFCDKHNLNISERLQLFISVCQAVQHAHQKGVIHRDLKPSNILITLDGCPTAKVIDFGVAKAINQRLTEKTLITRLGQMIGTPQYMSPEQAEMSGLDVDTRSDIYSLGVLLYELLTGTTPLDAEHLRTVSYSEMQRIIHDEESLKPSSRLSKLGESLTVICQRRQTDERRLRRTIRDDLDWIVMKTLEKRRDRRYQTANGLAADLERHLNNEPIVARPPSFTYRFQKALSRNRGAFITIAVVAIALIASSVISSWQMVVARRALENEETQRLKAEAAEQQAQASLYTSLLGQIRATHIARRAGYREEVFGLVRQALALDTPEKKLSELRNEAVASMGDFVGFRPQQIASGKFAQGGMRLSSDGRWLELRKETGESEVHEMPSGRQVGPSMPEFAIASLAFKEPGERSPRVLASSADGRHELRLGRLGAHIIEVATGNIVDEFSGSLNPWHSGSFLPGTSLVAVPLPQQGLIRIRDFLKKETVAVLQESGPIDHATFAPGGEFLLTQGEAGVNLYPFASAQECLILAGHPPSVTGLAFGPDGARLVSISKDRTIRLWDTDSGRRIWEGNQPLPTEGQAVAFSPDGDLIATGCNGSRLVQIWDAETGQQLSEIPGKNNWTWSLQFVADKENGLLLVRGTFYGAEAWQIRDTRAAPSGGQLPSPKVSVGFSKTIVGIAAAPGGQTIAFVQDAFTPNLRTAVVQDALGRTPPIPLAQIAPAHSVQPLTFTPDGQSVAVLTVDSLIAVGDAATGRWLRSFPIPGQMSQARELALSCEGRWLAVSSESLRGVDIFDFNAGKLLYSLPERPGSVYWLAWDPSDEPRLAIACDNGDISIWDLAKIDQQLADLGLDFPTVSDN